MDRRHFLTSSFSLASLAMTTNVQAMLEHFASFVATPRMPALFLGHGSPMNALVLNEFSRGWRKVGESLPKPMAILCISAHWETRGTFVTAMPKPRTIHDFGGFPDELYKVEYPAPGQPELAGQVIDLLGNENALPDNSWGLDHGAWSVIKHLYPKADVPVIQLSLNYNRDARGHYDIGRQLAALRNKGVLIIGSGNIVHNLRTINWHNPDSGFDWALETDGKVQEYIRQNNIQPLLDYQKQGKEFQMSVPTPEHFLPLLYLLSMREAQEEVTFFNTKTIMGSISMTSLKIG